MVAPPNSSEIVLRKSRFSVDLNYGVIFRRLWTKVHQIMSADAGEIVVCNAVFRLSIILFRSGDIRNRSAKSSEIAPKKHVFGPNFFGGGGEPPNFGPNF